MTLSTVIVAVICFVVLVQANESDINIPKECINQTIALCNVEPKNYPWEMFTEFQNTMRKSGLEHPNQYYDVSDKCDYNCETDVKEIRPYVYRSKSSDSFVVQTKYFEQIVVQTQCKRRGQPCFEESMGQLRDSWSCSCEEQMSSMLLLLYNPVTKKYSYIKHEFPLGKKLANRLCPLFPNIKDPCAKRKRKCANCRLKVKISNDATNPVAKKEGRNVEWRWIMKYA
ncbi:hypothetical protein evm_007936 [Chilo suppressalis]|nr:hypothetical protein evm_007936 [Chilo suppressalis]